MSRGPAYPYVNLGDAITLTRKLFDFAKRGAANLNAVLKDKWDYSPTSSSAGKIVAALKYYGLIDVLPAPAAGGGESIRITDRAYRVLVDDEKSPERIKALKEACLAPKAYNLCWTTWGRDLPESMRSTLIFSHGFNDSTVDNFLTNYKKSIQFAGLLEPELAKSQDPERVDSKKNKHNIGDYVQWEHEGVLGFPKALRLVKFSDDEAFAWVEGHTTGLPAHELIAAEAPPMVVNKGDTASRVIEVGAGRLSTSGQAPRVPPQKGNGMRQEVLSLDEGEVVLQWPANIGTNGVADMEEWVKFLLKRLQRSLRETPNKTEPSDRPTDAAS
ncbi:hypothetical protein [Methylibium sp.]|uniref:hypothetical protein n=1 Tax=Methylibium sp. TaxID=2067992 RepID=UPI003D0C792B